MPPRKDNVQRSVQADSKSPTSIRQESQRTPSENKERAYVAASRRSDRSLEARVESAKSASRIHFERTGKRLKIDENIVRKEEMYEEEDDHLPRNLGGAFVDPNVPQRYQDIQRAHAGLAGLASGGRSAEEIEALFAHHFPAMSTSRSSLSLHNYRPMGQPTNMAHFQNGPPTGSSMVPGNMSRRPSTTMEFVEPAQTVGHGHAQSMPRTPSNAPLPMQQMGSRRGSHQSLGPYAQSPSLPPQQSPMFQSLQAPSFQPPPSPMFQPAESPRSTNFSLSRQHTLSNESLSSQYQQQASDAAQRARRDASDTSHPHTSPMTLKSELAGSGVPFLNGADMYNPQLFHQVRRRSQAPVSGNMATAVPQSPLPPQTLHKHQHQYQQPSAKRHRSDAGQLDMSRSQMTGNMHAVLPTSPMVNPYGSPLGSPRQMNPAMIQTQPYDFNQGMARRHTTHEVPLLQDAPRSKKARTEKSGNAQARSQMPSRPQVPRNQSKAQAVAVTAAPSVKSEPVAENAVVKSIEQTNEKESASHSIPNVTAPVTVAQPEQPIAPPVEFSYEGLDNVDVDSADFGMYMLDQGDGDMNNYNFNLDADLNFDEFFTMPASQEMPAQDEGVFPTPESIDGADHHEKSS